MNIGPYELLEVIGKGGMGTVYRGRHQQTGQWVAVKVMAADLAADSLLLRRFEQEVAAAHRLQHPHIVQGLDFGVGDGKPYLVMELVEGQDLRQQVKELGPLAPAEAVRLTVQVADALESAHRQNLIHRDVKPENILVTKDGRAKLTDLGLIKDTDAGSDLTRTRTGLGTTPFMAPEQFENAKQADARCDVYGLGATLYYLLTGGVPFPGRGNLSILRKKLQNDFVPACRLVPSLSAHINEAIGRALEASPARRPRSCREFAELLAGASCGPDGSGTREPEQAEGVLAEERPAAHEKRAAPRFPCLLAVSCVPLPHSGRQWQGQVLDISLTGIHLQLERRFEQGAVLRVEVVDEQSGPAATWLARVRWVRQVSADRWSIGCALDRQLGEDEIGGLLGNLPPTVFISEEG